MTCIRGDKSVLLENSGRNLLVRASSISCHFLVRHCVTFLVVTSGKQWELGIPVNNYLENCPLKLTSMLINNNIIIDLKKYLSQKYLLFI